MYAVGNFVLCPNNMLKGGEKKEPQRNILIRTLSLMLPILVLSFPTPYFGGAIFSHSRLSLV